uniref:Uncharacterized protein n=1 Tax=Anguilla anguilla TaxID=7936 RepID=A0A0E9VKS6_ANGAN
MCVCVCARMIPDFEVISHCYQCKKENVVSLT